ncbi:hypothetical protein O6H91_07G060500 [Diphasiastrum complanatum]|uniref:Uncharacterized protein n=1 Tax=Diphasiastrum complanatum TaxID=34168 RepID=A0ACC2D665_DIPCM|nr:hypothetical protein O6H91_07G060500 [Diphasiastrum complanatum]
MAKGEDIWCSMVVLLLYCIGSFDLASLVYGEASLEVGILIEVKKRLDDPHGFLNNWNASDIVPCFWTGVTCDNASGLVNELDLSFKNLGGPVPTGLCLLRNLTSLNLGSNSLNGRFLDELFKCSNLMLLNLSQNRIVSFLPSGISKLQLLKDLDLSGNTFLGPIPSGFGELGHLESLNLSRNWLNETIPDSLGNLTNLEELDLSNNQLSGNINIFQHSLATVISYLCFVYLRTF